MAEVSTCAPGASGDQPATARADPSIRAPDPRSLFSGAADPAAGSAPCYWQDRTLRGQEKFRWSPWSLRPSQSQGRPAGLRLLSDGGSGAAAGAGPGSWRCALGEEWEAAGASSPGLQTPETRSPTGMRCKPLPSLQHRDRGPAATRRDSTGGT